MATIFSSSSSALLVVALSCAAAAGTADPADAAGPHESATSCPAYRGGSPLSGATVFDGPPEDRTDLMPDTTRGRGRHAESSWDVGYVFDGNRQVFLACRYMGPSEPLMVRIERRVASCTYKTAEAGKPVEMRCR